MRGASREVETRRGLHSGLGWLEVECNRCKTGASLHPGRAVRGPP
jgi:hypothetical protein